MMTRICNMTLNIYNVSFCALWKLVYTMKASVLSPFLKDPNVADEVLMQQMGVAVSAEKEREKKLRGKKPRSPLAMVASVSDPSNEKKSKQEPSQQSDLMAAIDVIKSEVEALKGEVRGKDVDKIGRGLERRRPPRCSSCVGKKEEYCSQCFKCGSDSHVARGCQKSLNGPLRDGKQS